LIPLLIFLLFWHRFFMDLQVILIL
jgi:hypothetical protein